ncbi:MAG: hypothetical protein MRY59_09245 [Aquisalinus sp.]|nr:hypothetical protein [Aquisalinus sp.]
MDQHLSKLSDAIGSIAVVLSNPEIEAKANDFLDKLTDQATTIYGQSMDALYNETHIGGGMHRLFDGGHDFFGAWGAVTSAVSDDSLWTEMSAYVAELWKDVVTPAGLPVVTWDQATYEKFSNLFEQIPGVTSDVVEDIVTYTGAEFSIGIIGFAALLATVRNQDASRYYQICGALGISAMVSANPLLVAIVIVASLRGLVGDKQVNARSIVVKSAGRGALYGAAVVVPAAVLGPIGLLTSPPLLFGIHRAEKLIEKRRFQKFAREASSAFLIERAKYRALPAPTN